MFELPAYLRFWVDVVTIVGGTLGLLTTFGVWLFRQSVVTHQALEVALKPIGAELHAHGEAIARLTNDIEHLPTAEALAELRNQMTGIKGSISVLGAKMDGLAETMDRIERPLNVLIDGKLKANT